MAYPDESNLTTVATLKSWMKVKEIDPTLDANLLATINRCSNFLVLEMRKQNLINKLFTSEIYSGDDEDTLWLRNTPITSVSSVLINNISIPVIPQVGLPGFTFDQDCIYLQGGYVFSIGINNIAISYNGGLGVGSMELTVLEQGALEMINIKWQARDHADTIVRKSGQMVTEKFRNEDIPVEVKRIINKLRNRIPVY